MLYAFILGRVYTLSLSEVLHVLDSEKISYQLKTVAPEIALIETETELNAPKLQSRLGGTIKIVQIIDVLNKKQKDRPVDLVKDYLDFKILKNQYLAGHNGKIHFGVSLYKMAPDLPIHFTEPKKIAQEIKKYLKLHEISVRFVMPEPPRTYLASAVVTNNHLLQKGAEFVILAGTQNLSIGKTVSVQDFEDYGRRDYQRPFRDLKMGMLPPKVAQIMTNLAQVERGQKVLDPFCGGGTVLQEALLLGLQAVGSDIDPKSVEGSEKNLLWFRNRYKIPPGRYKIERLDATQDLVLEFGESTFDAIITEGWLGPLYTEFPSPEQMKSNFKNLLEVYVKSLEQIYNILKPGGRVVLAFPAYQQNRDQYTFFPTLDFIEKLGYNRQDPIPSEIAGKYDFLRVTERKSMVYNRKDQIVAREIVVLQKNI